MHEQHLEGQVGKASTSPLGKAPPPIPLHELGLSGDDADIHLFRAKRTGDMHGMLLDGCSIWLCCHPVMGGRPRAPWDFRILGKVYLVLVNRTLIPRQIIAPPKIRSMVRPAR